jgi:hypothetical protein
LLNASDKHSVPGDEAVPTLLRSTAAELCDVSASRITLDPGFA